MPTSDPDTRDWMIRQLKIIRGATITLGVLLLCLLVFVVVRLDQVNSALCTYRGDLQERAAASEDFLLHPDKYPGISVPKSVVQQNLISQRKTIDSLQSLSC